MVQKITYEAKVVEKTLESNGLLSSATYSQSDIGKVG
jgi:hypothetical protein